MFWQRFPVFRIFVSLLTGILLGRYFECGFIQWTGVALGFSLLLLLITALPYFFKSYRWRPLFGVFSFIFFTFLGMALVYLDGENHQENHFIRLTELFDKKERSYLVQLLEDPVEKEKSYKINAEVIGCISGKETVALSGKLLMYFEKDSAAADLKSGQKLMYRGILNQPSKPLNPQQFDFAAYLRNQSIYAQAYASRESWKQFPSESKYSIIDWSAEVRRELMSQIDFWSIGENERSVSKALLLGYRHDIEDELLTAYANAGATHVLAVSGLHVGILYLFSYYLLFFAGRWKIGRQSRTILLLLILWLYACITGLSPSVVRAATMFTFVAWGTGFSRTTSIYSTLLASALFLLMINPSFIFEVGFQLSYLAVFGIVWLQPHFKNLWTPKNLLLSRTWDVLTVSMAAQLATFPLGLFYFHQFPGMFLLSNLLVIPLISLIMYSGIPSLLLSAAGFPSLWLVKVYGFFLSIMNEGISMIEGWDVLLINRINISFFEVILLYLLMCLLFTWLFYGGIRSLRLALLLFFSLIMLQYYENYQHATSKDLTVYGIRDHTVMGIRNEDEYLLLADTDFLNDSTGIQAFNVDPYISSLNVERVTKVKLYSSYCEGNLCIQGDLMWCSGSTIWMVNSNYRVFPETDIWLVNQKAGYPPLNVSGKLPSRVILSGECWYRQKEEWRSWCRRNEVKLVDVLQDGAYFLSSL